MKLLTVEKEENLLWKKSEKPHGGGGKRKSKQLLTQDKAVNLNVFMCCN